MTGYKSYVSVQKRVVIDMNKIYHEPDLMQFHGEVNMLGDRKTWNSYMAVWGDISKDTEDFVRIEVLYRGNNENNG